MRIYMNAWCNHLFLSVKLMQCLASLRLRHPRWSSFSFASHLPSPRYGNFGFSSRFRLQIVQIVDIYDICVHMAVLWTAVDAVIYAGNRSAEATLIKLVCEANNIKQWPCQNPPRANLKEVSSKPSFSASPFTLAGNVTPTSRLSAKNLAGLYISALLGRASCILA